MFTCEYVMADSSQVNEPSMIHVRIILKFSSMCSINESGAVLEGIVLLILSSTEWSIMNRVSSMQIDKVLRANKYASEFGHPNFKLIHEAVLAIDSHNIKRRTSCKH